MTVTYGSVTLTNAGQPTVTPLIITKKTQVFGAVVNGIQQVTTNVQQAQGAGCNVTIKCTTQTLSDYTALLALAGTLNTLVLPYGETYPNMAIVKISRPEIGFSSWEYS